MLYKLRFPLWESTETVFTHRENPVYKNSQFPNQAESCPECVRLDHSGSLTDRMKTPERWCPSGVVPSSSMFLPKRCDVHCDAWCDVKWLFGVRWRLGMTECTKTNPRYYQGQYLNQIEGQYVKGFSRESAQIDRQDRFHTFDCWREREKYCKYLRDIITSGS